MDTSIEHSTEYVNFRSVVPQKKICVDDDNTKEWTVYDMGNRNVTCPLICLPPVSARADVFYSQMVYLSDKGYRVISIEYPVYWSWKEFVNGFNKLLDHLNLTKVHLLGASLGGFLAQKFAEVTQSSKRVSSLILCNTFTDTGIFQQQLSAPTFWMLPASILRNMLTGNLTNNSTEAAIQQSEKFLAKSLNSLNRKELASRLTLNCTGAQVDTIRIKHLPMTIMDVNDECAISDTVKSDIHSHYPNARRAHLKSGGNFPYLSRASDVNLYIELIKIKKCSADETNAKICLQITEIHLREFNSSACSAMEDMAETNIDVALSHQCCALNPASDPNNHNQESPEPSSDNKGDLSEQFHKQAAALNNMAEDDDIDASSYW